MEIWNRYEKCRNYIEENGLINRTNEQWDFYLDNQWNVGQNTTLSTGTALPFLNIIKSSIKFQLSTIAQNQMIPTFNSNKEDIDPQITEGKIAVAKLLNKQLHDDWKMSKQNQKSWNIIKQGLIQGDSYQYCGTPDPRDDQIVMNTNIMFGDESNNCIQEQPYIIIRERLLVKEVKKIGKKNGLPQDKIDNIQPDTDDQYLINKNVMRDVEGKVTSILYMEKRDGVVWWGKSINGLEYEPMKPMESKVGNKTISCKLYPIASYMPEEMPNSARGKSSVRPMIPNQIEINKTIARRSEAVKIAAFPRLAYNANAVRNEEDLDKAGAKIAVDGGAESINQLIAYLNPVSQSPDAANLQADLIATTRELNGSVDALTGATDPTRVSGQAVYAMVAQSEKPLSEAVDRYKQFVEDLALIWLEQKKVYNPKGITVDGIEISGEALRDVDLEVSIDVSQDSPWTRAGEKAFLDNLLDKQMIDLEWYTELAPDNSEIPKGKLKKMFAELKKKAQEMQQQQMVQQPMETPLEPQIEPQGGMYETPM